MTTPRSGTPLADVDEDSIHDTSYFRQVLRLWSPASNDEAQNVLEETLYRAQSLSRVLRQYCGDSNVSSGDLKSAIAILEDLLNFSGTMLEFWRHDEELMKTGWTPPKAK